MKSLQGQSTESTFGFDVLTNEEMYAIKGGDSESKDKTEALDVLELE